MQVLAPDCLALPLESSINYSTPFLVNLEEACIQILPHLHSHKYPQCHRGTTYVCNVVRVRRVRSAAIVVWRDGLSVSSGCRGCEGPSFPLA